MINFYKGKTKMINLAFDKITDNFHPTRKYKYSGYKSTTPIKFETRYFPSNKESKKMLALIDKWTGKKIRSINESKLKELKQTKLFKIEINRNLDFTEFYSKDVVKNLDFLND